MLKILRFRGFDALRWGLDEEVSVLWYWRRDASRRLGDFERLRAFSSEQNSDARRNWDKTHQEGALALR